MRLDPDSTYQYRRWDQEPPVWSYSGPFADNQERLTQQALSVAFMSAEEIQMSVRPPLPQIETFPPRLGYPDYQSRQITPDALLGVTRRLPTPASTWYSGTPAGYLGSSRYSSNSIGLA